MDPLVILADVQLAVKLAKMAYDLGKEAAPYVKTAYQILFENKVLTTDERKAMTDQEAAWRTEIDQIIADDDKAV